MNPWLYPSFYRFHYSKQIPETERSTQAAYRCLKGVFINVRGCFFLSFKICSLFFNKSLFAVSMPWPSAFISCWGSKLNPLRKYIFEHLSLVPQILANSTVRVSKLQDVRSTLVSATNWLDGNTSKRTSCCVFEYLYSPYIYGCKNDET